MKISYKVPLIATAIITSAFAVFATYQFYQIRENLYEQTESNIQETSSVLGADISEWMNERLIIMQAISEIAAQDFSVDKLRQLFSTPAFNEKASYYYGGLDTDGKVINDYAEKFSPSDDWDATKRPWYDVAKRHNVAMMTEPYPDFIDNRLLITAVAQIYDGNDSIGAMGADIELKAISDEVNTVTFNDTGYAFLIDETGKILTHPDQNNYDKNISQLFTNSTPKISTKLQKASIGADSVLTAFFPLKNFSGSEKKWLVGVVVEEDKVLAPAYRLGINAIIAAVIAAILSSMIFYLFMNKALIKPVAQLTEQSDAISRGKLSTEILGTHRKDEIGELANAIQRLQKSLRMAMDRIRKIR